MVSTQSSGKLIFECPIRSDCPFVGTDGCCTIYGYDLRVLREALFKFCPQYDWRYKKKFHINEYKCESKMKVVKALIKIYDAESLEMLR